MYFSFIDNENPAVAILQLGEGVRWSYNGRGGRSNGTHYGGNVMINLMGGSSTDMSSDGKIDFNPGQVGVNIMGGSSTDMSSDGKIDFNPGQVGVNISVVPFEWVDTKNFFGEVGTVFDIETLNCGEWVNFGTLCLVNIRVSIGKNFYL